MKHTAMIEVTHFYGVHQGGTKKYHLYLFHSPTTGNYLLAKRWGKVGTEGQVKIEALGLAGKRSLNKALNEQQSSGYDMRLDETLSKAYGSVVEALQVIPLKHRSAFYINQLAHLDPVRYSKDSRDMNDPLKDERDAKFGESVREATEAAEAARKATALLEAEQEAAELKSNPFFGMF